MASCLCCGKCKPRYKRLVDNIFPHSQENGLVRSEMQKLTYYAVSAPEKLDRIGVYLADRLTRNIQRKRDAPVFIAMEALNQLLLACHQQQINLFVESFLKMVATLLESDNSEFQALGTNSFERFSKIEEDTPSYHRRYDFFVSKFSSMCHSNSPDKNARLKIQLHGVRGLRGVIRKTVSDELQVNIWEKQHMDKIVPSLLYAMANNPVKNLNEDGSPMPSDDCQDPWILAEESFRELLSRAAFANVSAAIFPALDHMDNHHLWAPDNTFAVKCFKIIMYSMQGQYTHVTVKMLLDHIDDHLHEDELIKASMLKVLCAIVPIPSSAAIGPSVIDVFNRLAKHLRYTAEHDNQKQFESSLIETTGVLASVVPDYQKLEILSFYINKAHEAMSGGGAVGAMTRTNSKYSGLLLQCLFHISENYRVSNNLSSLSSTLIDSLLKVALLADHTERLLAQQVFISVIDKNSNFGKLKVICTDHDLINLKLSSTLPGKGDTDFIDRRLPKIFHWLFESFMLDDNKAENYTMLYNCVATLALSLTCPDVIIELCRLTLAVQNATLDWLNSSAVSNDVLQRVAFGMAATACNMLILAHLSSISPFQQYVDDVLQMRDKMLPEFSTIALRENLPLPVDVNGEVLSKISFTSNGICEALTGCTGFNIEKLSQPFLMAMATENHSSDVQRGSIDVESINLQFPSENDANVTETDALKTAQTITFNYLKQVATKPPLKREEQMMINKKVAEHILSAPFEQLIAEMKPNPVVKAHKWAKHLLENIDTADEEEEGAPLIEIPVACLC